MGCAVPVERAASPAGTGMRSFMYEPPPDTLDCLPCAASHRIQVEGSGSGRDRQTAPTAPVQYKAPHTDGVARCPVEAQPSALVLLRRLEWEKRWARTQQRRLPAGETTHIVAGTGLGE